MYSNHGCLKGNQILFYVHNQIFFLRLKRMHTPKIIMDKSTSCLITISSEKYHETLSSGLWNLFQCNSGVDCGIHWGGRTIKAHRLILGLFLSPDKLTETEADQYNQQKHSDKLDRGDCLSLDSLLEFLYQGSVTIRKEQLANLLALAKVSEFKMLVDALESATRKASPVIKKEPDISSEPMSVTSKSDIVHADATNGNKQSKSMESALNETETDSTSIKFKSKKPTNEEFLHASIKVERRDTTELPDASPDQTVEPALSNKSTCSSLIHSELRQEMDEFHTSSATKQKVFPRMKIKMEPSRNETGQLESINANMRSSVRWSFQSTGIVHTKFPNDIPSKSRVVNRNISEMDLDSSEDRPTSDTELHDGNSNMRWNQQQMEPSKNIVMKLKRRARSRREPYKGDVVIERAQMSVGDTRPRPVSYKCNVCAKTFRLKKYLADHELIHTGAKSHACQLCDKTFLRLSQLNSHSKTHSQDRPFKCSQCERAFARRVTLKNHEKVHRGEKTYKCAKCQEIFDQLSVFLYHEIRGCHKMSDN